MLRRVALSGALGFVVLLSWTFVANAIFGFSSRVRMNKAPYEGAVHSVLKDAIVDPGIYVVNPELTDAGRFPAGEPVFSVTYAGVGHEAAGTGMIREMGIMLASTLLVAALLSLASRRVLARYGWRVLFVTAAGLFLALAGELPHYGIGGYPLDATLLIAGNVFLSWVAAALVIALPIRLSARALATGPDE